MSTPEEAPELPEPDAQPLSRWERLGASLSGVCLAGAGIAAVFMTSNQAGSVALLLVGAVLLIMAINGSPLTRARYQDYELLMAHRRRSLAATIGQEEPQDARQALEVLNAIDPRSSDDPVVAQVSAAVYEREVAERLVRTYPNAVLVGGPQDLGIDILVPTPSARVGVQVKAGRTVLTNYQLRHVLEAAVDGNRSRRDPIDGLLLVTNRPLPQQLHRRLREVETLGLPIGVVRWVDAQDDEVLSAKLDELVSRIESTR
ncbi:hypothetical protein ACIA6C_06655 [Streptomyces sp. NPDC051578]|uniref:hypothetical protein n=1 Tax=Streptomyces sp. NPDC051578 TaxID=3365662 RepID=UPI00378BB16E